ncbi:MAG: hypothetical protein JWO27_2116, partial [Frankiales bacterium]|nr:hypothetical protein [Frankiales bacterium]
PQKVSKEAEKALHAFAAAARDDPRAHLSEEVS